LSPATEVHGAAASFKFGRIARRISGMDLRQFPQESTI
jgi:hypothetical protein